MAAGLGFKTFTTGEVLTAADVNGYLMQGILVFANAAARSSAITSPQEGQYSFLKDTNALEYYDGAAWVGAPVGDITAVNAGTGITGGGASGSVTITNDMATTITAAGDIVVGTGSGTYDNLPIGTTGQVLTADTTVSPYKVKWASASSSPSFAGCRLYNSGSSGHFSIPNNTLTVLNWDAESFDVGGYHSTTTNTNRITVPTGKAGYYFIDSCISWASNTTGVRESRIRLNGSVVFYNYQTFSNGEFVMWNSITLYMAEGDYVELAAYQTSGGNLNIFSGSTSSMFSAQYLGA